jgi:hypothetical protein
MRGLRSALLAQIVASATVAQGSPEPVRLTRLDQQIVFDGNPEEPAWHMLLPFTLVQYQPISGAQPTESSDIRVGYDAEYLYVGARFSGSSTADMRSGSLTRDRLSGDNTFTLLLDTYGDRENALQFTTNPAGIRVDASIAADGQGNNAAWDSYWDVKTTTSADGWTMEMRIPFSSLRFQLIDGRVEMGMTLSRYIAKNAETDTYPLLSQSFAGATMRVSLAQRIQLVGIEARRPVYITPYALGGASRVHSLSADRSRFTVHDGAAREAGLDLKYTPTTNLNIDLTFNTDFAQAEADDQQVNLTRYPLFYPDRRQFFQERAAILQFDLGGVNRLFHSRRVGLSDAGEPLRIYGGVRAIGRVGGWDFGLLDMVTDAASGEGSENFTVLRLRRSIWKPGSTIGGILTSRLGGERGYNHSYATDLILHPLANDYVTLQWAQTIDEQQSNGLQSGLARLVWARRAERGLVYSANASWIGADFTPELGFQSITGRTTVGGNLRYGWFPGQKTIFRNIQPSINTGSTFRNSDDGLDSRFISNFLNFQLKNAWFGWVVHGFFAEDLAQQLTFGPNAFVPAGRHDYQQTSINLFSPNGSRLRLNTSISFGELYDGRQTVLNLGPTLNLGGGYLEIAGEYIYNRLSFPDRDQKFNADIARLRLRASLDSRASLAALVQYNKSTNTILPNVRFRYHFSEGRDLYVVFNDQLNRELVPVTQGGPILPRSQNRAIVVKYSHTFAY